MTALPPKEILRPMPLHTTSDIPFAAFCTYLQLGGGVEVQLLIPPPYPASPFGVSTTPLSTVRVRCSDFPR